MALQDGADLVLVQLLRRPGPKAKERVPQPIDGLVEVDATVMRPLAKPGGKLRDGEVALGKCFLQSLEELGQQAGAVILEVEPSQSTRPNIRFVPLKP